MPKPWKSIDQINHKKAHKDKKPETKTRRERINSKDQRSTLQTHGLATLHPPSYKYRN